MPHFGPRKIGQAQFELQKLKQEATKKFGPRKFGARKAAEMQAEITQAEEQVHSVTAKTALPAGEVLEGGPKLVPEPVAPSTLSVADLKGVLEANSGIMDELWVAEQARPNGPRKSAVKLFLATELAREDQARSDLVEELESYLEE